MFLIIGCLGIVVFVNSDVWFLICVVIVFDGIVLLWWYKLVLFCGLYGYYDEFVLLCE